jgi:hypothetical protein
MWQPCACHLVQHVRVDLTGDEGDGQALRAKAPRAAHTVQVRVRAVPAAL